MLVVTQGVSVCVNLRTHTCLPAAPLPKTALWGFTMVPPRLEDAVGLPGMYHPLLQALAPPGCSARCVRYALGVVGQVSIDALVGAVAVGLALGNAMLGQNVLARAYIKEHAPQVALAGMIAAQALCLGAAAGLWLWFLA